jgi:hypothetical protein
MHPTHTLIMAKLRLVRSYYCEHFEIYWRGGASRAWKCSTFELAYTEANTVTTDSQTVIYFLSRLCQMESYIYKECVCDVVYDMLQQ